MSDFDKEAERERLREKYERDKQKRQTTEKMSELLLQGATMTNAHCSDCNDPIFRYDGQEFCASCEKPVDRGTNDGTDSEDADGESDDQGQSTGPIEVTSPSDDARVSFGGNSTGESTDGPGEETGGQVEDETPRSGGTGGQGADDTPREQPSREQATQGQAPREQPPQADRPTRQQPATGGTDPSVGRTNADIGPVRDSLVRTLRRFSEQAEACEDPQRAREHLAAAREAAETLEALRR